MTPLNVALLWHQHQPLYRSPRSGRYSLPWVRLHAIKDYYDMAAIAGEEPRLHLTFNLVPSLLDQLEEYVAGTADDPALALARRPPADLDDTERAALMDLFFSAPYRTMIAPFARYAALYHKRGGRDRDGGWRSALARFTEQDLRDLQAWFHLAWSGPALRSRSPIRELMRQGDGFSEPDKQALLDAQQAFLAEVLPIHRRLQEAGVAELSTSPYYHPILPLLCDARSAREAIPDLPLPPDGFRRPADAMAQLTEGLAAMQRRFEKRPAGVWPSEGSLSDEVVRMMGECGIRWAASDEDLLRSSMPHPLDGAAVRRAWRLAEGGEQGPALFFRDHDLSDRIGFVYATWPAEAAAADLIGRLRQMAHETPGGVVSLILDGENAWEHYPANGADFLRAFYRGLATTPELRPVTFSEALEAGPAPAILPRLRAGSWIGASFSTWMGHPEKNAAWGLLRSAREAAEARLGEPPPGGFCGPSASRVWTALAAAEGSDWFWWFGDDHSSEQDAIFDESFRELLRGVWQGLGLPAPPELEHPIKSSRVITWSPPTGRVSARLDGAVTDYFEWLGAGVCEAGAAQGAMHQSVAMIRRIAFGTDGEDLYVRIDPAAGDLAGLLSGLTGGSLEVVVESPQPRRLELRLRSGHLELTGSGSAGARFACGRVVEVAVPLEGIEPVAFHVALREEAGTLQRLPRDGAIRLAPAAPFDWSA